MQCQGSEKLEIFLKKPNPLCFLVFIGFWILLFFSDFFLFEQAVGKLFG